MKTNSNTTKTQPVAELLASLSNSTANTGCRFISLRYTNSNAETSLYTLIMGIDIQSLYKSDLRTLTALRPTLIGVDLVACEELRTSIMKSMEVGIGNNPAYTLKGYYAPVNGSEVKSHDADGSRSFYLKGYVLRKRVITPGVYKTVKSSAKTIAKRKLEKLLKRGSFRTFKLDAGLLHAVKANGITLEIS